MMMMMAIRGNASPIDDRNHSVGPTKKKKREKRKKMGSTFNAPWQRNSRADPVNADAGESISIDSARQVKRDTDAGNADRCATHTASSLGVDLNQRKGGTRHHRHDSPPFRFPSSRCVEESRSQKKQQHGMTISPSSISLSSVAIAKSSIGSDR